MVVCGNGVVFCKVCANSCKQCIFSLSDYVFSAVIAFRSKCSIIKEAWAIISISACCSELGLLIEWECSIT